MDIRNFGKGVTDRARWAARGASVVAKLKATKVVWFPPKPVAAGGQAASAVGRTAKKATTRSTGKAARSAKSATSRPKKAKSGAKKATGAVRTRG